MKHQCELKCHEGKCLDETKCINKVNLKCVCKTLKKSFICNQIKSETSLIEFSKKENKYHLICNEKCNEKKQRKEDNNLLSDTEQEEKTTAKSSSFVFFNFKNLLAIAILIIAIIFYLVINNIEKS